MKTEEGLKLLAAKHASSTSAIQQAADIWRQFAIVKAETKTDTAIHLPNGFGLKGLFEDELDRLKASGILILKLPARKAILDHVISCPNIFGKAMHPKTTRKGFVENGMINNKAYTYPDIYKLFQTCKQEISKKQEGSLRAFFFAV